MSFDTLLKIYDTRNRKKTMSNWIYYDPPVNPQGAAFAPKKEERTKDALGKIARLVPGPVLGAYGASLGTLPLFKVQEQHWVGLALFILGMVGTAWIVGWQMGGNVVKRRHIGVYVLAFAVWAYSLTGEKVLPWVYHPGFAALSPIVLGFILYAIPLPKLKA